MQIFRQISVRLILLMSALLVGAFAVHAHLNYAQHRQHLDERMKAGALRISEIVLRSTHHAMMENSRDRISQIITSIGEQSQVEAVRIYGKTGKVFISTHPEEIGQRVDAEAEACQVCHPGGDLHQATATEEQTRIFTSTAGHRVLGMISLIYNEPACSNPKVCHDHDPQADLLGVLDLQLSLAQDDADLSVTRSAMIRDAIVVTFISLLGALVFIVLVVRRPIQKLIAATKSVARLDLNVDVGVHSEDEIGELARSFERMAGELRRAQEENLEWAQSLETKVREKTRELERAQAHLIHVEKMASLGKLSAVIAHEINNPLASVMTYARLVSRRLGKETPLDPEARQRLQEHLSMIESETRRCGDIVKNMLIFAKKTPMGLREVDLREVIDRASRLVQHGLEIQQVEFRRELPEIDYRVVCSADQIQQMLVALMVNATEAMETDGGVLTLSVRTRDPYLVEIAVSDTGTGIPEEIRGQIFEPFFTTKDGTRGVGLGLAVVHGIVESHGGTIDVDSVPGRGTTFRVTLPRRPPRQKDRGGE